MTPIPHACALLCALSSVSVHGDTVTLHSGRDVLVVQAAEPNLLHVHYEPHGFVSTPTEVLDRRRVWPSDTPATIDVRSDPIVVRTAQMVVKISRQPVRVEIEDAAGKALLREPAEGGVQPHRVKFVVNGSDLFFGIDGFSLPGSNIDARQDVRSGLVRTGGLVRANQQGDGAAPLVYTNQYGLLVDSGGGNFTIRDDTLRFTGGSRRDVEYFVAVGPPESVMQRVAQISGAAPMSPKWTLGFLNSQWGTTQAQVEQYVATYRKKQIPLDGFILDFDWKAWGEDDYGEWRWNSTRGPGNVAPDKYPDGASGVFAKRMGEEGVKLVGIFKPRILLYNSSGKFDEAASFARAHHFFYPGEQPYQEYFSNRPALDIDFANSQARAWYWQHTKPAYEAGIVGFWNDEADAMSDGTLFNNFQFLNMQRALYDGVRSLTNRRVWSLNRNFYLGAQRYAYAEWSGDIGDGFDSMEDQAVRMLSTVDLGEAKWSMDTGGFWGHPTPENYARWMQFAAFVPIDRVHCILGEHRQPWAFGAQAEAIAKAAVDLRYALLPYIYSYDREAYEDGVGLVRPLFWEFPDDTDNAPYQRDEWMFGKYLLVSPVFGEGQSHLHIYLPKGTWTDYFRGTRYTGGTQIDYSVNPQTWRDIPLFIREGAIVPTRDVEQYVGQKKMTRVYVDVFPSRSKTSFTYYDDDGTTYDYEKGVYYRQVLSTVDDGNGVEFDAAAPTGRFTPDLREFIVRVHGVAARTVQSDGTAVRPWSTGTDRYGAVTAITIPAGRAVEVRITPH